MKLRTKGKKEPRQEGEAVPGGGDGRCEGPGGGCSGRWRTGPVGRDGREPWVSGPAPRRPDLWDLAVPTLSLESAEAIGGCKRGMTQLDLPPEKNISASRWILTPVTHAGVARQELRHTSVKEGAAACFTSSREGGQVLYPLNQGAGGAAAPGQAPRSLYIFTSQARNLRGSDLPKSMGSVPAQVSPPLSRVTQPHLLRESGGQPCPPGFACLSLQAVETHQDTGVFSLSSGAFGDRSALCTRQKPAGSGAGGLVPWGGLALVPPWGGRCPAEEDLNSQ